jgi:hypothetical protein
MLYLGVLEFHKLSSQNCFYQIQILNAQVE